MDRIPIEINVNGEKHHLVVETRTTLLELLREQLFLTGAKEGCGEGICGSCTVLLDDKPVRACLTLAVEAAGHRVTTVEGLSDGETLDPLQQAFIDHGAVQCGFCTPGMLMSARALLLAEPQPDEKQIARALSGNICRCTGYTKIVEAVEAAAQNSEDRR